MQNSIKKWREDYAEITAFIAKGEKVENPDMESAIVVRVVFDEDNLGISTFFFEYEGESGADDNFAKITREELKPLIDQLFAIRKKGKFKSGDIIELKDDVFFKNGEVIEGA